MQYWVDLNGDGLLDVTYIIDEAQVPYLFLRLHDGEVPDMLKSITNGFGLRTNLTYKPITDSSIFTKSYDSSYPVTNLQSPSYVVSVYEERDGLNGLEYSAHYHYSGLRYDLARRSILAFDQIDSTNEATGLLTSSFYRQDFPYTALPFRSEVRLSNGMVS